MPGNQNVTRTWREITADLARDVFSPRMLWALIGAAGLSLCFIIYDATFRNGCVNFGFFQSSACKQASASTVSPDELKAAILADSEAIKILKGEKGDDGAKGSSIPVPTATAIAGDLMNNNQFISRIALSPDFAQYTAKALIAHHRDQLIPETSGGLDEFQVRGIISAELMPLKPFLSAKEGAVIAFNRSQDRGNAIEKGACPTGWSLFHQAGGRFLVGAGTNTNVDQSGKELTDYPSFLDDAAKAVGGEEQVELNKTQIPAHEHVAGEYIGGGTNQKIGSGGNTFVFPRGSISTLPVKIYKTAGSDLGNASHNNMPPYIALYFCKMDQQ